MRLRQRLAPALLLALPALSAALSVIEQPGLASLVARDDVAARDPSSEASYPSKDVGTKDAPVDGLDGKPHAGPFVERTQRKKYPVVAQDLGPGHKPIPADDGLDGFSTEDSASTKKLINDIKKEDPGVMRDESRAKPKKGTTGTEGGVSERTGAQEKNELSGKVELKTPEKPKEAPPLPGSDQIGTKTGSGKEGDKETYGLKKPVDLPDKPHDIPHPAPLNSKTDPKDIEPPTTGKSAQASAGDTDREGVIQPFHSFILSYTMIIFSEIGDKTFLVAALMAMRHPRLLVFSAAFSALIAMTVLSAVLGHAVPTLLPQRLTTYAAAALFLIFGARLLREGLAMSPEDGVGEEMKEVEMEIGEKENMVRRNSLRKGHDISPYALESGRGRRSRSNSRLPAPPRSPSSSRSRSSSPANARTMQNFFLGLNNLFSLLLSPAWVQTFIMTFLGEWGDRSQIATIAMAAGQDYWWVTLGALVGHACCTAVAVIGGRAIAGKVSMRIVTLGGATAFLIFGLIYLAEAIYAG